MHSIFRDIEAIGRDIVLVYSHFVHWTISRTIIVLSMFVLMVVTSIPAILLIGHELGIIAPLISSDALSADMWTIIRSSSYLADILNLLVPMLIPIALILVGILIILSIVFMFWCYGSILAMNVCRSYFTGTPLPYHKNLYLSWRYMSRYAGILTWISLYLLIPAVVVTLVLIAIVVYMLYGIIVGMLPDYVMTMGTQFLNTNYP